MRALRLLAVGALIAAGIAARLTTPTPAPTTNADIESRPRAVACPTQARCIAVGLMGTAYGLHVPFGASLTDGAWTLSPPDAPSPVVESGLLSLSCAPAACMAVGREEVPAPYLGARSAGGRPLIRSWDGATWVGRSGPIPPGTRDAGLNGVSCASSVCVAVGQYGRRSGHDRVLAMAWDGDRWTLQLPPRHRYQDDAALEDIACLSPTSCIAVGRFSFELQELFTAVAPLIERWDGTAWHLEVSANVRDSLDTELNAIACPTPSRCVAVGFQRRAGGILSTFAEVRNGIRWTVLPTPNPEGSPDAELADVACPRPDRCFAVGTWVSGSRTHGLLESWDGTRWTIEQTPVPESSTSSTLSAIDCPGPRGCYAVGAYERGSPTGHAFALAWDGAGWAILPIPEPVGPT